MKGVVVSIGVMVAIVSLYAWTGQKDPVITHSFQRTDVRNAITITKTDWRRDGFGMVAVADISFRNNNSYAVQIDQITCTFRAKTGAKVVEKLEGVYTIVHAKSSRILKDIGFGFIDRELRGECRVTSAKKG